MILSSKRLWSIQSALFLSFAHPPQCIIDAGSTLPVMPLNSVFVVYSRDLDFVVNGIMKSYQHSTEMECPFRWDFRRMSLALESNDDQTTVILSPNERKFLAGVTKLNISGTNMKKLPKSVIKYMPNLESLDLSNNCYLDITEDDLDCIGERLESITIRSASLTKDILKIIFSIPSLKKLDISGNDLSEIFVEDNLAMKHNRKGIAAPLTTIYKRIQKAFGTADGSETPELTDDYSEAEIIRISSFINIIELKAINCKLTGNFFKIIRQLKNIRVVDLSSNPEIGEHVPDNVATSIENITNLTLRSCNLSSTDFALICNGKSLVFLDVACNSNIWNVDIPNIFENIKDRISSINFSETNMTVNALRLLKEFACLKILDISHNTKLGEAIGPDFDFGNLNTTVEIMNLENIHLPASGVKALRKFSVMKSLNMRIVWGMWEGVVSSYDFIAMRDTLSELYLYGCEIDPKTILDLEILLYRTNIFLRC